VSHPENCQRLSSAHIACARFRLKDGHGQKRQHAIGSALSERLHFYSEALAVSFEDQIGAAATAVNRSIGLPSVGPEQVRNG
jgi:hypothetical protein